MTLTFSSLEEFIGELAVLRENVSLPVRFRREEEAVNEAIITIGARASAIANVEGEQALLEWSDWLGRDVHGDDFGSQQAQQAEDTLAEACQKLGLTLRPGRIEL